jgi:hypothetical protein
VPECPQVHLEAGSLGIADVELDRHFHVVPEQGNVTVDNHAVVGLKVARGQAALGW